MRNIDITTTEAIQIQGNISLTLQGVLEERFADAEHQWQSLDIQSVISSWQRIGFVFREPYPPLVQSLYDVTTSSSSENTGMATFGSLKTTIQEDTPPECTNDQSLDT